MTEAAHSKYSASGFEAAMLCPGKPVMEAGKPNNSSAYSREGTAAHQLLEWCINDGQRADAYHGRRITVEEVHTVEVDDEMVECVNWCLDRITEYAGDSGTVLAESRVWYADAIGVAREEGWGTADVIILRGDEITVMDLKYGRGVEVSAVENVQMRLYALGALDAHDGVVEDFKRARMVILQPRISRTPSEWDCSVAELRQWAATEAWEAVEQREAARTAGGRVEFQQYLRPGEKQCKFCKAKATCPALRNSVTGSVFESAPASPDEFNDETTSTIDSNVDEEWIAACLSKVDLIEDWCKSVRAEAERRLLAGEPVPGFKLVQGKRGARAWVDAKAAEELLKSMRLKQEQLYDFSVKSPTQIAKLGPKFNKDGKIVPPKDGEEPPVIGPRQWPKVAALITQAEGKPHVAPATDPRPALEVKPVEDEFDAVSPAGSTVDDLA